MNTNLLPTDFKHVVFGEEHNISNGMNGWMDDIAVFAAGLAEEDIKRLAGGASPEEIRPLVAPEPTPPPVVVDPPVIPALPPMVLPPIPGQQPGEISGIAFDNGNAVIPYTGTLKSSDTVDGTYAPVAGAASPFTATTTGSAKFYIAR